MTTPFQFSGFQTPLSGHRKIYRREIKYNKYTYKDAIVLTPISFQIFDITPPDLVVKIKENEKTYVIPLNLKFICDNVPYFESMLRDGNNFREKNKNGSEQQTEKSYEKSYEIKAEIDDQIQNHSPYQPAEVELKNFRPKTVQQYFKCIYEGSVDITTDDAFDIYDLADYFQDTETRSQCVIHIKSTMEEKHLLRALEYTEFDQKCITISSGYNKDKFLSDFEENFRNISTVGFTKLVSICDVHEKLNSRFIDEWIQYNLKDKEVNNEEVFKFLKELDIGKFSQETKFNLCIKVLPKYLSGEKLNEILDSLPSADEQGKPGMKSSNSGSKSPKKSNSKNTSFISNSYSSGMTSAYAIFSAENHGKIKSALKKEMIEKAKAEDIDELELTYAMIAKKIGQAWRNMSEDEQMPYEEQAKENAKFKENADSTVINSNASSKASPKINPFSSPLQNKLLNNDLPTTSENHLSFSRKRPASTFGNLTGNLPINASSNLSTNVSTTLSANLSKNLPTQLSANLLTSTGFASPSTSFNTSFASPSRSFIKSPENSTFKPQIDDEKFKKVSAIFGGKKVLKDGDVYHTDKKIIMDANKAHNKKIQDARAAKREEQKRLARYQKLAEEHEAEVLRQNRLLLFGSESDSESYSLSDEELPTTLSGAAKARRRYNENKKAASKNTSTSKRPVRKCTRNKKADKSTNIDTPSKTDKTDKFGKLDK